MTIRGWENLSRHTGLCIPTLTKLVRVNDFPKPTMDQETNLRRTWVWDASEVNEWQNKNQKFGRTKSSLRFTSVTSAVNSQLAAT